MPMAGTIPGTGVLYPYVKKSKTPTQKQLRSFLLFGVAVAFFIFSVSAFIYSLPQRSSTPTHSALVPAMAPVVEAASGGLPSLEVHIANNGLVLLRSATVVSVNGTGLVLSTNWGSSVFIWTVTTNPESYGAHNYGTRFIDSNGNQTPFESVRPGGLVTVTGMLDTSAKEPTVAADMVRVVR